MKTVRPLPARRFLQQTSLLLIVGLLLTTGSAKAALSVEQRRVLTSGIGYFNTEQDANCQTASTTALTPNQAIITFLTGSGTSHGPYNLEDATNLSEIYNYFIAKGLSITAAAGIVGNTMQESKGFPADGLGPPGGPNGPSIGIAQWNDPGRWNVLEQFAQTQGKNPTDLGLQLDFMWQELHGPTYSRALTDTEAAATASDAAKVFNTEYEGSGDNPDHNNRMEDADDIMKALGLDPATGNSTPQSIATAPAVSCGASGSFSGTVDGTDAKTLTCPAGAAICYQNAVYYSQGTGPWAKQIFSPSHTTGDCIDVGCAGCGVTAAAMAISTLINSTTANPGALLPQWQSTGLTDSGGTGWSLPAWQKVAATYGIKVQNLAAHSKLGFTTAELSGIVTALQAGDLVAVSGEDANSTLFTTAGHFVMIRGVTSTGPDGQFIVSDPKDNFATLQDSSKTWPWSYFEQTGESIWVFSK